MSESILGTQQDQVVTLFLTPVDRSVTTMANIVIWNRKTNEAIQYDAYRPDVRWEANVTLADDLLTIDVPWSEVHGEERKCFFPYVLTAKKCKLDDGTEYFSGIEKGSPASHWEVKSNVYILAVKGC